MRYLLLALIAIVPAHAVTGDFDDLCFVHDETRQVHGPVGEVAGTAAEDPDDLLGSCGWGSVVFGSASYSGGSWDAPVGWSGFVFIGDNRITTCTVALDGVEVGSFEVEAAASCP